MDQFFSYLPNLLTTVTNNKLLDHFIIILLSALAAFIPRYIPLHFFSSRRIPEWFNEWMKYIPVSLFMALVVKGIFISGKTYQFVPFGHPDQIIVAVIVAIIAYFTRSMSISVIIGLLGVWLVNIFI